MYKFYFKFRLVALIGMLAPSLFAVGDEMVKEPQLVCPKPIVPPKEQISKTGPIGDDFVDNNLEIKDFATKFVVNNFFSDKDTLFNFMKLTYGTVDKALVDYKIQHDLTDQSIFTVFKGGNVLRMLARGFFSLLNPEPRRLLEETYSEYVKRSDADFSIYPDKQQLNGLDYDQVFKELTDLTYKSLSKVRDEVNKDPKKYIDLFKLNTQEASTVLNDALEQANAIGAISDENNPNWYGAKIRQLQFLNVKANPSATCDYQGQYDSRIQLDKGNTVTKRLSNAPSWLPNTDNRTIRNVNEKGVVIRFDLVRLKAIFNVLVEKNNELRLKSVGGEFADFSVTHDEETGLHHLIENYPKTVAQYRLSSSNRKDHFMIRAYTPYYAAHDLHTILFENHRPWETGPKYVKRLYRFFLLYIADLVSNYGVGSPKIRNHISDVDRFIILPLTNLLPLGKDAKRDASRLVNNIKLVAKRWNKLDAANEFWDALGKFVTADLVNDPKQNDITELAEFLDIVNQNLNVAKKISKMAPQKVDLRRLQNANIDWIF